MTSSAVPRGGPTSEQVVHKKSESDVREGCAAQAPATPTVLESRRSWINRAKAVIVRSRQRRQQRGLTKLRPTEISAVAAVIGRCVVAPLLLVFVFGATGYLSTAKFFIGPRDSYFAYSQLDSVMHGGCSGCICSCRTVLLQLSAFGSGAMMSKPAFEDLQAIATKAEVAGDYTRLTPEALALADQLDANGAVCSTGMNDWGTPNIVLADEPEGVLAVITTLGLSLSPQMLRELQVAVDRKEECISRWNIGILLRLFKFQNVKNSLDYSSVPAADIITFPHFTDCRPDISNEAVVGEKLAVETHGEDLLAVAPDILKLFPYQFTSSLPKVSRYIPAKNTIYGVNNVTQPLFKGYYAGCRVRVVNTTGVYVEDTCALLKHWQMYGLMLQAPDDLPVCSTGDVCVHNQYNSEWEYTNDVNPTDSTRLDQVISVFRSRYADTVGLSVLPGVVVIQIIFMGIVSLYQVMSHRRSVLLTQIWAYRCQNGRMQPIYFAQITYHLAFNSNLYYLGLSTGTLSTASEVNLTLSFFAFNYSFINLIRARSGDQMLDRHFRIPWEILQLTSTICTFVVLSSLRLTSLAFIGELNGELLRRTSVQGAIYCGLKDSCYVFTVNLVFVVATISIAMGFIALLGAMLEKRITRKIATRRGTTAQTAPLSSSFRFLGCNKVGPTIPDLQRHKLTTFEENCLGGQFIRLFYDCEDFAYITFRGKRCTTVEALLLTGYIFYGQHVYQATSVLLLLVARVLPRKVIRTFNVLLIRWRIDPHEGKLSQALSCTWYSASAERFKISEATPVA
ncbi:hypothetical protein PC128_g19101 [Phytophthora cactorum]|nr:hypothetical protein PC120_g19137 [Phytophthora cactorum]KAG3049374.1 hypothetical protein PC121_g18947 [Phytophthora cactorum]KAG3169754.1 hypothetical protein PC128_g19101 [Phytophthora cactorum]KAG4045238.1 hypothetical protein PC123_g19350 [Phytophthora cactorum]